MARKKCFSAVIWSYGRDERNVLSGVWPNMEQRCELLGEGREEPGGPGNVNREINGGN